MNKTGIRSSIHVSKIEDRVYLHLQQYDKGISIDITPEILDEEDFDLLLKELDKAKEKLRKMKKDFFEKTI
jgi:hypothetical protein